MNKKCTWENLDKQGRAQLIIGYIILVLFSAFTAFVLFGRFIPSVAALEIYGNLDIVNKSAGASPWLLSASYAICIFTLSYLVRKLISLSLSWLQRGGAVISLLTSFIKYVAVIVAVFLILAAFGVNTEALIAGIGILSLVVGLAIQPLLQDIIAGVFVVFEKTYDVGDVIVVDGFRGTVTEIGIRTTKIRDAGGDVKVINNSDIRTLVNMTRELSYAICDVDIEYGESLERVERVIEQSLGAIKEKIPSITDGPYYKGVVALGASGVTLRLVAECPEGDKFQTQRDMNRQIKIMFDKNNIGIPYTQIVVHNAKEQNTPISTGETDSFVLEQNELSRGIEEDDDSKS